MTATLWTERRQGWNQGLREQFKQLEERWNQLHPPVPCSEQPAEISGEVLSALTISPEYLRVLRIHRPNVLLVGSNSAVARVVNVLANSGKPPIASYQRGCLSHANDAIGTLVVHQATDLDRAAQAEIFGWLSANAPTTQVITTASTALFPAVLRGAFDDALFYRLNQLYLVVK